VNEADFEALMEDTPVGENHGRRRAVLHSYITPRTPNGNEHPHLEHEVWENLGGIAETDANVSGVVRMVPVGDETYHGMVAHRGTLSEREKELLDWEKVERLVYAKIGATAEEVEAAYTERAGAPSAERLETRAFIDARLLAISEAGGNMSVLATVFGWDIDLDGKCQKMQRALRRARKAVDA
jgi:hypothetical protein